MPCRLLTPVALLLVIVVGTLGAASSINVHIVRHFPCSGSSGPAPGKTLIKFPGYKTQGVQFRDEYDDQGHKCFRMSGGRVEVFPPGLAGNRSYFVHLETRIGINGHIERCVKADRNGCGGIGSCVHCDICRTMGGSLKNFVQIYQGNAPAQCSTQGLNPGHYTDLSLKVCLPDREQLLPFIDENRERAEKVFNLFIRSHGGNSREIPLVIAARIYDEPINNLPSEELNDRVRHSKRGMIGCHWIHATLSEH